MDDSLPQSCAQQPSDQTTLYEAQTASAAYSLLLDKAELVETKATGPDKWANIEQFKHAWLAAFPSANPRVLFLNESKAVVMAGLLRCHSGKRQYFEAAKWIAALQDPTPELSEEEDDDDDDDGDDDDDEDEEPPAAAPSYACAIL